MLGDFAYLWALDYFTVQIALSDLKARLAFVPAKFNMF